ncbi:hypothetical protein ABZ479_14045 [Streptomyces sp. NPDC005722]
MVEEKEAILDLLWLVHVDEGSGLTTRDRRVGHVSGGHYSLVGADWDGSHRIRPTLDDGEHDEPPALPADAVDVATVLRDRVDRTYPLPVLPARRLAAVLAPTHLVLDPRRRGLSPTVLSAAGGSPSPRAAMPCATAAARRRRAW